MLLYVAKHETFVAEHRFSNTIGDGGVELRSVRHECMELPTLTTWIRCGRKIGEKLFIE
jgi:hypothetical protein